MIFKQTEIKKRKKISIAVLIVMFTLIAGALSSCNSTSKSSIIVSGSTSVQPFAEVLAEEYMILHPEIVIDVQGGGSSAGIKTAQTGTADIGMSSRDLKEEEKSLWYLEIARDGLAVILHPSKNIHSLTLEQVRDIYSSKTDNWSEIGGLDSKIHVITREEGSGTRSAFESLVMDKQEISPRAIVQDSNGAVRQLVADDENSIGFVSLGLVNKTIKALELDGVAATKENVINGSYNLSRPFIFVTKEEPTGEIKDFIDFVMSEEGQKILEAEGLVPSTGGEDK